MYLEYLRGLGIREKDRGLYYINALMVLFRPGYSNVFGKFYEEVAQTYGVTAVQVRGTARYTITNIVNSDMSVSEFVAHHKNIADRQAQC